MMPLVEFCINNMTDDVLKVKKKLETDSGLEVVDYYCLRQCGICSGGTFALLNGEVVRADKNEDLLKKIYKAIEDMEIRY